MWHARWDIVCQPWGQGYNQLVWAIWGAHLMHLLLLGDFVHFHAKAIATRGFAATLEVSSLDTFCEGQRLARFARPWVVKVHLLLPVAPD